MRPLSPFPSSTCFASGDVGRKGAGRHPSSCTAMWSMHMFFCMRTTLNLDDELMRTLKRRAAESGRTMTELVEEALREALGRPDRDDPEREFRWVSVRGRVRPGVDVADRDSLLEKMEGRP